MSMRTLEPAKVKKRGMEVLARELGAAGMVQFMQQFSPGYGDYSKSRHSVVNTLSVDEAWAAMKKNNNAGP